MKKPQTAFEKYKAIQAIGTEVEVPWDTWRMLSEKGRTIYINGNDISLGEDFGTLEEARKAIEFYVTQLGGTVKWSAK